MGNPQGERVRIELLGRFNVVLGDRAVPEAAWPSRRSAELVQLLALADRHWLLREQAIEALWPQLGPEAGAANLRKAAHHARLALGRPAAVELSGGRVALFAGRDVETDVACFEQQAEAALRSRDGAAALEAASAYGGELLPEARYEEWTQARRNQLKRRYCELLRLAGQWERLVEVDPADEPAYRELIRAALADGNRHAAIRWYGRLRRHLERDLGVPPGPESENLYAECVAGLQPAASAFVGRHVELSQGAAAVAAAEQGEVGALIIRGPAGIGKSALCRQVAAVARGRGWRVVTAAANVGARPYAPLVSAVEQFLRRDRAALNTIGDRTRSVLAALTPLAAPAPPLEGALTRHRVIGAVRRLFQAGRGAAGVLVVVDDVHLAGDATADACAHLALAGGGLPFLAVLAYRPEAARPVLIHGVAGLDRALRSMRIDLGPLDRDEVIALATAGAGVPPDDPVLARVADLAQGNPFFALELAGSVGADARQAVPATVWSAVTARFLELDEASLEALQRLAVSADDVDPAGVVALTGLSEPQAFALLDHAIATGALVVADGRYRFRHDLVRRALIEQVRPHRRIVMHRDAARGLAGTGAPPGLVARHWLDGGRPDEAVEWLLVAARHARSVGAFTDALGHLEPLLSHVPHHAEALLLRAEVLDALGDGRAPAAYAAAAEAIGEPESHDLRARMALAQLKLGDPPGALHTLDGLAPTTDRGRLAQALTLSGLAAIGASDAALAAPMAAESRRMALRLRDTGALVEASWAQALAAHARGELPGSLRADLQDTRALPELAIRIFDGQLCVTQRLLYGAMPYPEVIAIADGLAREAERIGAARGHAFAVTLRGEARLLSGQLDEAEADLTAAARLNRAIGAATGEALALQRSAEVQLHRGRPIEARVLLNDALSVARESDVGVHVLDRIYGARIAATDSLAAVEEAEAAVRGPVETCPTCRITLVVPAAIAAARAGDIDRAAGHARVAEMLATVIMRLPGWDAAVEEVKGHLAAAMGDVSAAISHFRAAADGYRGCGQPLDEARCRALVTLD
jgi:DNA-binding SARP family transcriptional activator/tetratricopeptide (TPR) repeat protein